MENFTPQNTANALLVLLVVHHLRAAAALGPKKVWKLVFTSLVGGLASVVPGVSGVLDAEKKKALADIEKDFLGDGDPDANTSIPAKGLSKAAVLKMGEKLKLTHSGFSEGRKWGGIYHTAGSEQTDVQAAMWSMFNSTNTLYPGTFPAVRKFEAEIIKMVADMCSPADLDAPVVGLLSSGGTESILLAALSYREQGLARGITSPNIVCCETAHPAIHKACRYFGIELIKCKMDSDCRMTPATAKPYITSNTVALYASAPTFPHGVIDDIEGLSDLALQRKIGLHVDNCLGGFLLSFMKKNGLLGNRKFDFEVPGVTTMSVDVHKYGGSNKGNSVCLFRNEAMRQSTYMPSWDGCEGLYVTPTIQGSRSGATIAAAWSTMIYSGQNGYDTMAKNHSKILAKAKAAVAKIDGLEMLVVPDAAILPLVASAGSKIDIYLVASALEKRGWNLFTGQSPPCLGLCIGDVHLKLLDPWVKDLEECVEWVKKNPDAKPSGNAAVYGSASTIPDDLLDSILRSYVDISLSVKPTAK
jgi:sphinganine-1-phosphate aldolase